MKKFVNAIIFLSKQTYPFTLINYYTLSYCTINLKLREIFSIHLYTYIEEILAFDVLNIISKFISKKRKKKRNANKFHHRAEAARKARVDNYRVSELEIGHLRHRILGENYTE